VNSARRWRRSASAVEVVVAGAVITEKDLEFRSGFELDIAFRRTIPDVSSNCYYMHYPNTLALVGRSPTIDQRPGCGPALFVSSRCVRGPVAGRARGWLNMWVSHYIM